MNIASGVRKSAQTLQKTAEQNFLWLKKHMSPYFFMAMGDEPSAILLLAREMGELKENRRLILTDREKLLTMACVNTPGSIYNTLRQIGERSVSYAMFSHSNAPMPDMEHELEVQRFEFDRRPNNSVDPDAPPDMPAPLARRIKREFRAISPEAGIKTIDRLLGILWQNNENYIRMSPPQRTAYILWLFCKANSSGGIFVHIEDVTRDGKPESRVLFAVGNPPEGEFLLQILEVFNRLDIGIRRAYCQTISNGVHPYFLGLFYVISRKGEKLSPDGDLASTLKRELCTTQILSTSSPIYKNFVAQGKISGEDAALVNAFVSFSHTTLAHNMPDRFTLDEIEKSFHDHPEMGRLLARLFRIRFDPDLDERESAYRSALKEARGVVEGYNTGHRWLDENRRVIYRTSLLLVTHTLKSNFFVPEKQALAFRLDPSYLKELGDEFRSDLPEQLPFRITFFFSRFGAGYHIGFSDIARGGWRTVIARSADDFITQATTIFREVYVLAHTQHLKNKDIYEGGSKLVLSLDASDIGESGTEAEKCRLYKLQYSVANAFLDIFITKGGRASDQRIVDYYGDDEPIELGPDENMHDAMIEAIASLSVKRGYMLGSGIISSKRIGINHKEYGVTSTGVVKFAAITMEKICGINIYSDPFTLKMTGGPNGDVAGNSLRILLANATAMRILLILDGTAALCDPSGISREELSRIVLGEDLDSFNPARLNDGGSIIYRSGRRIQGMKESYRKLSKKGDSLIEQWLDTDDFYQEYDSLIFEVRTDIFIPAGGRPETIDGSNWSRFIDKNGKPSSRIIIEGANSYITPEARIQLQKSGVVIMRDASANKCGVISSSYEIIANLLLSDEEFLEHKGEYVNDVLEILEKRAADEARLILARASEPGNTLPCTEISEVISRNINTFYGRLFDFFSGRPELCLQRPFIGAILNHLPAVLVNTPKFRKRISKLPQKYLCAILAAEIGSSLVYTQNRDSDFEDMVRRHLARIGIR